MWGRWFNYDQDAFVIPIEFRHLLPSLDLVAEIEKMKKTVEMVDDMGIPYLDCPYCVDTLDAVLTLLKGDK